MKHKVVLEVEYNIPCPEYGPYASKLKVLKFNVGYGKKFGRTGDEAVDVARTWSFLFDDDAAEISVWKYNGSKGEMLIRRTK